MFHPYDHVLVRNNDNEEWIATLYSHTRELECGRFVHVTCAGTEWLQCVPYDLYFVGTTEPFYYN